VDFETTGAALHSARQTLLAQQDAGIDVAQVEPLAAGIIKGLNAFLATHQDEEFTLEQALDAADARLRMDGTLAPDADERVVDAVHEATAAATRTAAERMGG
jgi:hypothetical protein